MASMQKLFNSLFFLFSLALFAAEFDAIFVGTSPFCLLEALYQSQLGKKVLILEEHSRCGGAWKTIDICGVPDADLGCHYIGSDPTLQAFLENYLHCKMVSLEDPTKPYSSFNSGRGYYFSHGCHELIQRLLERIAPTSIQLLTDQKVESISISADQTALVSTKGSLFTAHKVFVTPMSQLHFPQSSHSQNQKKHSHYHLYLLIDDPVPPRFSYRDGILAKTSRLMNLTPFTTLHGTGKHLIILQTHKEESIETAPMFLEALKSNDLVSSEAFLLKAETYIYEAGSFSQHLIGEVGGNGIIEMIQTGSFLHLSSYLPKWKEVLH